MDWLVSWCIQFPVASTIFMILIMGFGPPFLVRYGIVLQQLRSLCRELKQDPTLQLLEKTTWKPSATYQLENHVFSSSYRPELHIELPLHPPLPFACLIHHQEVYPLNKYWKPLRPGATPTHSPSFDRVCSVRGDTLKVLALLNKETRSLFAQVFQQMPHIAVTHEKIEYIAPHNTIPTPLAEQKRIMALLKQLHDQLATRRNLIVTQEILRHLQDDPCPHFRANCAKQLLLTNLHHGTQEQLAHILKRETHPLVRLTVALTDKRNITEICDLASQPAIPSNMRIEAFELSKTTHPPTEHFLHFLRICSTDPNMYLRHIAKQKRKKILLQLSQQNQFEGKLSLLTESHQGRLSQLQQGQLTIHTESQP